MDISSKHIIMIIIILVVLYFVLYQNTEGYKTVQSMPSSYRICDGGSENYCHNLSKYQKNKDIYYGNEIDGYIKIPFKGPAPDKFSCVPHGERLQIPRSSDRLPLDEANKYALRYPLMPIDFKPFSPRKNKMIDKFLPPDETASYSNCYVHSQDDPFSFFDRGLPAPNFTPI